MFSHHSPPCRAFFSETFLGPIGASSRPLCDISASSKKNSLPAAAGGSNSCKGVGFKSVFTVSDRPHMLSKATRSGLYGRVAGARNGSQMLHMRRANRFDSIVFERYAFVFDVNGSLGKLRHVTPTSLGHLERLPLEVKKAHGQATTAPRTSISIDFHVFSFYLSIYIYILISQIGSARNHTHSLLYTLPVYVPFKRAFRFRSHSFPRSFS